MDAREKIEEAHGLWELAIVRLAAFAEARVYAEMAEAVAEERKAFKNWKRVSELATSQEPIPEGA